MNKDTANELLTPWTILGATVAIIGIIVSTNYGWLVYIASWAGLLIWAVGLYFLSTRAYPAYWAKRKGPFGIFSKDGGGSK